MAAEDPAALTRGSGPTTHADGPVDQRYARLLQQRIDIPGPVAGHIQRAELSEEVMPTRKRLTILKAPAGFGKTSLLADCCRGLGENGVWAAWVSLDEYDEPAILNGYIAFACQSAGLDLRDASASARGPKNPRVEIESLTRAVDALGSPFVLAFDEVDRVTNPASLELLEILLQRGPSNLHLAMTCRELPDGLNVGGALMEGQAKVIAADDLRFSQSEIARFLNLGPRHKDLTAIMAETAGWPFAVWSYGKIRETALTGVAHTTREFVANWIESRLFLGFGADKRDLLLDIGLFEWVDAELLDEVLRCSGAMRQILTIPALDGLLSPIPGETPARWRLHPLIREHCLRRRFRDTPDRFNSIHRRIATALMERGETVTAMCHAIDAGDQSLAADILEHAGGARMPMRQGNERFLAADRLLNEEIVAERPRLRLSRCSALALSGHPAEARKTYAAIAEPVAVSVDGAGPGDGSIVVDDYIVRGSIFLYGAEQINADRVWAMASELSRIEGSQRLDPLTFGNLQYRLCIGYQATAQFDKALARASLAREKLADDRSMSLFLELEVGQIAMAQGRVADAQAHYGRARRAVRRNDVFDAAAARSGNVLMQELALECNRLGPVNEMSWIPRRLVAAPTAFSIYAAASGTVVEWKFRNEGADRAVEATDKMREFASGAGLPVFVRYLTALRVSSLAAAGRVRDAEREWRLHDLPEDPGDCLLLTTQSWREMEALSCARLRLMTAQGRFDEGRGFARDLRALAAGRRLRRTEMRALSLSMALEHRAGEQEAAARHLEEFLGLFAESPYVWPLVREQEVCRPIVELFRRSVAASLARETAQSFLEAIEASRETRSVALSDRERQVLERLEGQGDKQIAISLGLTAHGVRHHLRKLFTKLSVGNRSDAVRRAKELGLLFDDG